MSDGYRRGGSYTRNGRTYQRQGARIGPRKALYATAATGITFAALTGGALVGSPVLVAFGVCALLGYVGYRNRRRLRPVTRRLVQVAERRYGKRNTRPMLVARRP